MTPHFSDRPPLRNRDDPITADAVLPLLKERMDRGLTWVAGSPFEYLEACPSTNAVLKEVAETAVVGTAVVTDEQTSGRGRMGRTWSSTPGADLTFSVLLRPRLAPESGHLLSLATGVAVAEVLEEAFGLAGDLRLKWPNDVLIAEKKVCGILLEASVEGGCFDWAVAGIGLNVNSEATHLADGLTAEQAAEWRGRPAPISLREHLGTPVRRAPLLAALLVRLTYWWTEVEHAGTTPRLLAEWRNRDFLLGRRVEVISGGERAERLTAGVAAGVGEEGQLLVQDEQKGRVEVFAGDVTVASMPVG